MKRVCIAALFSAFLATVFVWRWYSARYARFPIHRLPDIALFQSWKNARTHSDIASIHRALEGFKAHYGRLPYNSPERSYQFSITLGHDLNGLLTNTQRINSEEVVFWNVPAGEQRDGWGRLYHYHFDHDGNGQIDTGTQIVSGDYFVWSDGPDQTDNGGTKDDIH